MNQDHTTNDEMIFDQEIWYPGPKNGNLIRFTLSRSELREIEMVFRNNPEYIEFLKLAEDVRRDPNTKLDSHKFWKSLNIAISSVKGDSGPYYPAVILELISDFVASPKR